MESHMKNQLAQLSDISIRRRVEDSLVQHLGGSLIIGHGEHQQRFRAAVEMSEVGKLSL